MTEQWWITLWKSLGGKSWIFRNDFLILRQEEVDNVE